MASFYDYSNVSTLEGSFYNDVKFCNVPTQKCKRTDLLKGYPEINLGQELNRGLADTSVDSRASLLIPVNETFTKRVVRTFFEDGFLEALKEINNPKNFPKNSFLGKIASCALKLIEMTQSVKVFFLPHLKQKGLESIEKYSETRNWKKSPVRYIRWHPNYFKLAIAAADDSIRIYGNHIITPPVLKSWTQKHVTCLAWRPFSANELAVGCETGVLLWTIDQSINATQPPTQTSRLQCGNHKYITSTEWSPNGQWLATASINDSSVLLWDVDQQKNQPLKRFMPPCTFLRWSPKNSFLFSATVGKVFRVWKTDKFSFERWTIGSGNVQSAAWSPCETCLLLVNSDESTLYRLQFTEEELLLSSASPNRAIPIADLSKIVVGDKEVGGLPQSLAWDSHGYLLAVSFKDSPCIALFTTSITKYNFNIVPASFIEGEGNEYPTFICFQKLSDNVLTIGWSSGRVEFFPVNHI